MYSTFTTTPIFNQPALLFPRVSNMPSTGYGASGAKKGDCYIPIHITALSAESSNSQAIEINHGGILDQASNLASGGVAIGYGASQLNKIVMQGFIDTPTISTSYYNQIIAAAPLYYYRLDESSGTNAADQMNQQAGTYVGAIVLNQPGALTGSADMDSAVNPNGVGYVDVTGGAPFILQGQQTFEGWAKGTTNNGGTLIGGSDAATAPFLFFDSNTQLSWYPRNGAKVSWAGAWPATNTWTHWALTWDDLLQKAELFINGVSQGKKQHTQSYGVTGYLRIGASAGGAHFILPGLIDEVSIYNYILTPATILNHYQAGVNSYTSQGQISSILVEGNRITFGEIIAAYYEGRTSITSSNVAWQRVQPAWFRDSYGRVYATPLIYDLAIQKLETAPFREDFTMTLVVT